MPTDPPRPESDQTSETQLRYRALTLRSDGQISEAVPFSAYGDDAALAIGRGMIDGHAVELWEGSRFIERFDPREN